ncbi:MAG TPA: FAD-dependent oxidoreductase [Vicinamibacteria bacterium]|nr:FAD-dependent oxidoreductase [Vicinamibacteria bacterium]
MKNLVILGAGTGGTTVARRLRRRLPAEWTVSVVDPEPLHLYQPGLLFLPFGARDEAKLQRPREKTLRGVRWIRQAVTRVDPDSKQVVLAGGERLGYDLLVVASGARTVPEETAGMLGPEWGRSVHEFYTLEGALALRGALAGFERGRLVVDVVEMPIKCPVAPLEFLFLADAFFRRRGLREQVDLVLATPLDGAFTRPTCNRVLGHLLESKGIRVETEFATQEVDADARRLRSYDDRELAYDLLVAVPVHSGAAFVEASGLGNELAFVPTDPATLAVKGHDDIFAIGDATDLPSSKAGSVAHFQAEVLQENLLRAVRGRSLAPGFDGHANCFIETGFGKAILIDFNYETEPLPGRFPLPVLGPMRLLEESRLNHLGKLAFRWIYWNALLPGRPLPVTTRMSMLGKKRPAIGHDATEKGREHAHP